MADRFISVTEAASRLGVHRVTLYKMLESGRLPSAKLGSRRLVAESTINNMIAAATVPEVL